MSDLVDARLAQLAEHWELSPTAAEQLRAILDLTAVEHASITAVRAPEEAVEVHVADSLAGLAVSQLSNAGTLADLGAGGGFPGLALAVARPSAKVTLIESVGRKCEFLRRAAAVAGLGNVEVVHARIEDWTVGRDTQDVVTARALAPLNVLVEYAAPLLRDRGVLVAWKARRDVAEERHAAAAAAIVGLDPAGLVVAEARPGADHRAFNLYLKVHSTPNRFPRRAGMARKYPLVASS